MPGSISRTVFQLDKRGTADALQQALEFRRQGLPSDAMAAAIHGLAAELLADALLAAGYVVGVPQIESDRDGASGLDRR